MRKQQISRYTALLLAAFTGLAAGLVLPGLARWEGLLPDGGEAVTAVFAEQSFSITPAVLPDSGQPPVQPQETSAETVPAAATPAPDASAFAIRLLKPETTQPSGRILIYHTHTYEAYEQTEPVYRETEKWRTADESCNMIRVGEELSGLLHALGYEVVHDTTAFEPPDLSSAYTRSLAMLEQRQAAGEAYDLYIDLHRDAYSESQKGGNTVNVGGTETARLMLLIGKGEGYTGSGYDRKPDWEANLQVAQSITDALNEQADGLCKDVRIKSGRFNQHVSNSCILVEAGNNRNTLAEVLAAMPYLADAIHRTLCP
ncbi:MAG: stage II sporulation protein P [Clostridia bacterium]|nr:stage II sporulation protein P [Clostridia bacterium]